MKRRGNQGYVRMSVLVIGVAIAILVMVCVLALSGYMRTSYVVKTNNVAQRVYSAAQEYLDYEKEKGQLDAFNEKATLYGKALSSDLLERIFRENYVGNDIEEDVKKLHLRYKEGDIRYIVLESANNPTENRNKNVIFDIFKYQITDDNLWQEAFLIEYDSVKGEILTVFYSKEIDNFIYEGETSERTNVIIRNEEQLKNKKQGYFGVRQSGIFN